MVQTDDASNRILWCGNLHDKVTEELLFELFLQAGPLEKVKIVSPTNGARYAFITFKHKSSVPYTLNLMSGIRLFDRPLRLQPRNGANGGQSGPTSSPGTPVLPTWPNQTPNQFALPSPGFLPNFMPPALPPLQFANLHTPPVASSDVMPYLLSGFQRQQSSFHRSYSVPEMSRNGGKMSHRTGGSDDRGSPYARPTNADISSHSQQRGDNWHVSTEQKSCDETKLVTQLQSFRQMSEQNNFASMQPRSDSRGHYQHQHQHQHQQHRHHHEQHRQQQQRNHHDSRYGHQDYSSRSDDSRSSSRNASRRY